MLPWSVIPSAGWPSATAASTRSSTRAAPSSIENSVWVCRWVNDPVAAIEPVLLGVPTGHTAVDAPWSAPHRLSSTGDRPQPCGRITAVVDSTDSSRLRGRCRAGPARRPGPPIPGGRPRWRISSSWARAAICWAISVAWMPWKSPSSQPTSWAWATRSSASEGIGLVEGERHPVELGGQVGAQRPGQLPHRLLVDLAQPGPAGLVEGAARTSSSSCLTIEPIRITLAGCSTDSVTSRSRPSPVCAPFGRRPGCGEQKPRWAARRVREHRLGGIGTDRLFAFVVHGPDPCKQVVAGQTRRVRVRGPGHQRERHLGRGQRTVAAQQPGLTGVGGVEERHRGAGHEGHVPEAARAPSAVSGPPNHPSSTIC